MCPAHCAGFLEWLYPPEPDDYRMNCRLYLTTIKLHHGFISKEKRKMKGKVLGEFFHVFYAAPDISLNASLLSCH
jgi:hypothetical protein